MSGKKYVPEGVYLVCDKGAKPSELKILYYEETFIYGEKIATSADKIFIANFDPFGACACANGSPCTAPVTDWTNVTDGITLNGNDLLLEDSELPCTLGGNIKIFFSLAAATAAVPKPEKNFFEKMFDALPEGIFKTYVDFEIGVAQGLWKGLKGTVTGIVDLVVWSGKHTLPYIILNPQGFKEQLEKDKKTLEAIGNVAEKAGTWAYRNSAVNMLNDPSDYIAAQQENSVMAGKLMEKASNMSTREWGDVTGQIFFEVALEVGTAGVASTLTAVKAADRSLDVIKTVNALENATDGIKVLENAEDILDGGRTIKDGMRIPVAEELGDVKYLQEVTDPPGTFRDSNGKLRNENGTFAEDPKSKKDKPKKEKKKDENLDLPPWKGATDYSGIDTKRFKIEEGMDFTKAQKDAIYEANMKHNDGYIRSDLDGTVLEAPKKSESGITPSPTEAQVDHKIAKSKGGNNDPSENAQILSREQNRAKSDN
ncbi:PAAR-like protein [Cellulophaga baltica]|uniref:PAAR-like protein n=1 Tax=Cellulophaga baltica TaxID=76594 RepID=UPI0015F473DC|nr:PAAR-like protein [Cellulophaga baltica]MBA6316259.1 DUF4280 domain-containing protein [Cellulophaga baltica]